MTSLKPLLACTIALAAASAALPASAQTPAAPNPAAPVYVVGYIDVTQASKSQAMTIIKQFRSACAKEDGNQRCEAAQRMEQQNEFVVLQVWKDQKSFEAHNKGPGAQFRGRLRPILSSPYDERVHSALSVMPPQPAPSGRVVYVVTHIDIAVSRVADAPPLLTQMAEASRRDAGNSRFEVLQQRAPAASQFTLVEIWSNKRQLEAHQALPRTIQFRDKLQPLMEALYDAVSYTHLTLPTKA